MYFKKLKRSKKNHYSEPVRVLIFCYFAGSHGVHGTLTTVDVEPCPAEPCALPHGKNITLRATFTPCKYMFYINTYMFNICNIVISCAKYDLYFTKILFDHLTKKPPKFHRI